MKRYHLTLFCHDYSKIFGIALNELIKQDCIFLFKQVGLSELKKRTLQVEELAGGVPSAELARSLNELGVLYFLQNDHE